MPGIVAIGIHRSRFLVEVRRREVDDEAVDAVTTVVSRQGIVVDTGL